jgi:PAS domain S-box-containing protein
MTSEVPTIVVVDDAVDVRNLVKVRLRLSRRFQVVGEGSNGVQAVELAGRHQPQLLLLDVSMPVMDGLEALPRILLASPRTRVVLYSGFDERGLAERGRELGAVAFLEKSASVERLADDLTAILGAAPPSAAPAAAHGAALDDDERLLGQHLERFREVFEEAAIGMATLTLTGQVVRANKALAALLSRTATALVGTPYAAVATGDGGDDIAAAVASLCDGSSDVVHVEHRVVTPAGERRISATFAAVRGEQRQPLYLFLQAQDVTEQQRAAEELRQSEERFRMLVEAVEDYAIFMLDPQGLVVSWNTGAQRIKGYGAEEVIGRHFRLFYPPEKQAERHPEWELDVALREGHYEEEGWRVRKDGTRFWANVVLTAVHGASGKHIGFAKVTRDITARRRTLEEREQAAVALAAANDELEAMNSRLARAAADQSQFLAVAAHEIRGPVGVIGGSVDTLARHWGDLTDDERGEMFTGMVASASRLRRLLGDLLTTARLEAGAVALERHAVRLADVLTTAAASATLAQPSQPVVVDCPPDLEVVADPDRLAQAVDNLLHNALRHGAPPVHITAARVGGGAEIRVTDAGAGVPPEIRPRLFDRFATGELRRGTGLGLFIVRQLARAHGGDAWYDEGEDTGTGRAFVIALPNS